MSDILRLDYINRLPQPLVANFFGGSEWELHDIDVETGLMRIIVAGKIQVSHIGEVKFFRDANGSEHDSDGLYVDVDDKAIRCAI